MLVSHTTVRVCGRRRPPRTVDSARRFAWLKHSRQSTSAIPPAVLANHLLTRFARRYEQRLTLVSRRYADAALYAPPPRPKKGAKGRPRVKGQKLPSPQDVVQRTKQRQKLTVNWYGGQPRRVEVVTGRGHWYKSGEGLVAVRWVFVQGLTRTHRDEDFFTTNVTHSEQQVIETFTGRWSIEVTFQEVRAHLGVETTRGWIERRVGSNTVLRAEPCLFGLYSVVALWYAALPDRDRDNLEPTWIGKTIVTFSDAITLVRCDLWRRWIFATPAFHKIRSYKNSRPPNPASQSAHSPWLRDGKSRVNSLLKISSPSLRQRSGPSPVSK